jgi:hypothetical protein
MKFLKSGVIAALFAGTTLVLSGMDVADCELLSTPKEWI